MSQHTPKLFFARTITIPAVTATLLSTLLAAAGWVETDSHEGVQCIFSPVTETLYIGDDENVRDAAGVGTYQGFPLAAGDASNLAQYYFAGGVIDPNATWVYSVGSQPVGMMFKGI